MAGAVRRAGVHSLDEQYERHRGVVMGMLGKRFPRFDEDERLAIYHDAWIRVLAKRERGEEIESLRAYLLATCAAEALHAVSRSKAPTPVGPQEPLFTTLADEGTPVDEQVVIRDQARMARDLLESLDSRQRDVLKLRWDLQLRGSEVRAALGLSRRQYQRLVEEGAVEIAKRVEELEDGTWSRRQRSLLTACLVQVTTGGEGRRGIASNRQRREAQRLLESDPHFAALFNEIRGSLNRAAALLPLPVLLGSSDALAASQALETVTGLRDRAMDLLDAARQQATSIYIRAADPTLLSSPRPGTVVATLAGCVAVGGGAFGAYDAVSKPPPASTPVRTAEQAEPIATTPLPSAGGVETIRRAAAARSTPSRRPVVVPEVPEDDVTAVPPVPPPTSPPAPPPAPQPTPSGDTEFGFEN